jgi:ribonuclease BN (tRNA processing enzyme)
MKIYFLGHSEIIVEIKNYKKESIRILNDAWLSNFAFGDFLQRNPIWNWNYPFLGKIDYIYLSHPHCDHFDPYSLYWIYQHQKPTILLPENIGWAEELIRFFLKDVDMIILQNNKTIESNGIKFTGITFYPDYETNEKDVMTLFISNEEEIIFLEEDCAIPENRDSYQILYNEFSKKNYKNRVYICVRNELEGFFLSTDEEKYIHRTKKIQHYLQKRQEEIQWDYYKFEENDLPNIYQLNNFIKIYTGQGMIYPIEISKELLKISSPLPLKKIVEIERKVQKKYLYNFPILYQEPGYIYEIEKGKFINKKIFTQAFEFYHVDFKYLNFIKKIYDKPIFDEKRNLNQQRKLIFKLLERLYIYLGSNPQIPFLQLLKEKYCIEIRYGFRNNFKKIYYYLDFSYYGFIEKEDSPLKPWEIYWANDIEDYYRGKLDQFSSILLNLNEFRSFYFWTMLGLPFLNNDIVKNKIKFHFENAFSGRRVDDYVLPIIKNKIDFKIN